MGIVKSVVFVCVVLMFGSAHSQDKWYAAAKIGLNTLGNQTIAYATPSGSTSGRAHFNTGIAAGGVVGYEFGNDWRLEGEALYKTSELDSADVPALGVFSDGDYSSVTIAVNGFYDFNSFGNEAIRSYVGAGIGWLQEIDIDFEQLDVEQSFSGDEVGFQAMLGARYSLTENWFIDAEARYFYASGIVMKAEENAVGTVTADYDPMTLAVSVGWRF